jgi:hypothetical protein
MARRQGGKAASRRSRQRRAQRQRPLPPSSVARPTRPPVEEPELETEPDEPRPKPRRALEPAASAPSAARAYAGGSSSLTDRERAEYHYVERDLRNIGVLTAILLVLLLAAWFVFNALGLVG